MGIDAGVKVEEGYDVYEEGVSNRYFCQREDGSDFVAAVWPGDTHFPDMLNKEARTWFGDKYRILTEQGIEGFWNDMNEPAIFYSQEGMAEMKEVLMHFAQSGNRSGGITAGEMAADGEKETDEIGTFGEKAAGDDKDSAAGASIWPLMRKLGAPGRIW